MDTHRKKNRDGAGFWSYFQFPGHAIALSLCLQQTFSYLISTFLKLILALWPCKMDFSLNYGLCKGLTFFFPPPALSDTVIQFWDKQLTWVLLSVLSYINLFVTGVLDLEYGVLSWYSTFIAFCFLIIWKVTWKTTFVPYVSAENMGRYRSSLYYC